MTDPCPNERPASQGKRYKLGDTLEIDGRTFVLGEAQRIEPGETFSFEPRLPEGLTVVKAVITRLKVTMSPEDFGTILRALRFSATHAEPFTRDEYQELFDGLWASREQMEERDT